jgi:hypothetical protein
MFEQGALLDSSVVFSPGRRQAANRQAMKKLRLSIQ